MCDHSHNLCAAAGPSASGPTIVAAESCGIASWAWCGWHRTSAPAAVRLPAALLVAFAALLATPGPAAAQNATGTPAISGHKVEGERLSVNLDAISDPNGRPFTNVNILWYAVDPSTNVETAIWQRDGTRPDTGGGTSSSRRTSAAG